MCLHRPFKSGHELLQPALSPTNYNLYNTVYDQLVSQDPAQKARPELAESWEWSPDFLQLTMKMRQGVKFHTGRAFGSEDAKFNLERIKDPAVNSQWRNYAQLFKMETPDPTTLVIKFDAPRKSSFDAITGTFIADPQTLDQTKDGKNFVGTGPFKFKEWVPNDHFTVVRNPEYWKAERPYLDEVNVKISPDAQGALVNLESGGFDWMGGVEAQDARRLEKDKKFQLLIPDTGGGFWYVGMDVKAPALADKRVRQAFAWALDRKRLIETGLFGFGRPASILWPTNSPAYDKAQDETYTYDLGKARALLQAAGYDTGQTVSYTLSNAYPPTSPMTELYQQDLAQAGIKVNIQKFEHPVYLPKLQGGQFGGAWMSTIGFMNLHPATFFISAFPVRIPNASNFVNDRYKALIEQTYSETDDQRLKGQLKELTAIMLDEAFVAAVAQQQGGAAGISVTRSTVKNVTYDISGWVAFEDVWLEK
jgi:peptide/nickel transport system substrate-binding protein